MILKVMKNLNLKPSSGGLNERSRNRTAEENGIL